MDSNGNNNGAPARRLLTRQQAAIYLGISPRALWTLANMHEIPAVRSGKRWVRYDVADLDDWIERNKRHG